MPAARRYDRSKVTLPGYHAGREPGNKGAKLKIEILTVAEIQFLLDSFGTSPSGIRNHLIVWLLYAHDIKVGELPLLEVAHYSPERAELTIPKTPRYGERKIALSGQTTALLDAWLDARQALGIRRFAPLICTYQKGDAGRRMRTSLILGTVVRRARSVGIKKRVHPESLRASGRAHRNVNVLERELVGYLDQPSLRARYPRAMETLAAAQDLATLDSVRHATQIGHDCRNALSLFTRELAGRQDVEFRAGAGTVDRLRAIMARVVIPSDGVRALLDSLIPYWGSVSDLAQRQEHGAEKEGERLDAEDARRLLFHTMTLIHEIDRSIRRQVSADLPSSR